MCYFLDILAFDNSYSRLRSKTLKYLVTLHLDQDKDSFLALEEEDNNNCKL
jgi:hypothetical protein